MMMIMMITYFQPGPLPEILTIANLQHAVSRVCAPAEPKFRLSWMKLHSSNNALHHGFHMSKLYENKKLRLLEIK